MSINDPRLRQQVGEGVVALVNGSPIYLRQLDEECIVRHGTDVLQGVIGRRMLELACTQNQVTVSEQEIDAEIAHAAAQMTKPLPDGSPDVKGWLALACKQQGVSVETYRREVVWPAVALKKLAVGKIDVTEEDLKKGFEANYGPRVRCRAIVLNNLRRAQEVWEEPPRREDRRTRRELRRTGREVFDRAQQPRPGRPGAPHPPQRRPAAPGRGGLRPEAGRPVGRDPVGRQVWVILFCEGYTKPIDVKLPSVKKDIVEDIRDKKERLAMNEYYERLQESTTVDNFLDPTASHSPSKGDKGEAARQDAGPAVPTAYETARAEVTPYSKALGTAGKSPVSTKGSVRPACAASKD